MHSFLVRLRHISVFQAVLFLFMLAMALFMALPIVYIISTAFKPLYELFQYPPPFFVTHPTMTNFSNLLTTASTELVPFSRYLFNSVVVTALTVLGVIFASSLAAYALSKHEFRLKGVLMGAILVSLMFAPATVLIPTYLVISFLHLNNTYFGYILPYIASPVIVFLMKQFIDQIPNELLEAAKIDGASEIGIFGYVIVPLTTPAMATGVILTFQAVWNDTNAPTLYMQSETMKTVAYYVTTLTSGLSNAVAGQGVAAAASFLMFLPGLVIFLLAQRKIMQTMAHSGLK